MGDTITGRLFNNNNFATSAGLAQVCALHSTECHSISFVHSFIHSYAKQQRLNRPL